MRGTQAAAGQLGASVYPVRQEGPFERTNDARPVTCPSSGGVMLAANAPHTPRGPSTAACSMSPGATARGCFAKNIMLISSFKTSAEVCADAGEYLWPYGRTKGAGGVSVTRKGAWGDRGD